MRLSDTEWTVMNAVWMGSPASVRDVLDRARDETDWAYSTVKTLLTRLAEKGALDVTRRANVSYYSPRISRDEARRSAIRSLLDRAFDGAFGSLVQHLASKEKLSRRERQRLAEILEDLETPEHDR